MAETTHITELDVGSLKIDTVSMAADKFSLVKVARVALAAATGGGGVLAWANPEGVKIIVHKLILDITTKSTGAATGDFGVAANGTTTSDTLIDGTNLETTGYHDNINQAGTNGKAGAVMSSTQYITGTASASPAGLVGYAYILYSLGA